MDTRNGESLISIITPTTLSRANCLLSLRSIVKNQDYKNIEHIIITDENLTIGAKRNLACEMAKGKIIVHFDDDDFYSPDFITQSLNHLLASGADVTGLSKAYFFQREPLRAWLYDYAGSQPYVIGNSLMYHKTVWERNKFKDINEGEDKHFLANAGRIIPHNYINGFCAFIHGKNTASHKSLSSMKAISPEYLLRTIPNLY